MHEHDEQFENDATDEQVGVASLWSAGALAREYKTVPVEKIVEGIEALGLIPAVLIDGVRLYTGSQVCALHEWLLTEAQRISREN